MARDGTKELLLGMECSRLGTAVPGCFGLVNFPFQSQRLDTRWLLSIAVIEAFACTNP